MQNQKIVAQFLDTAASRADIVDREPATSKQCWFLAGLMVKEDDEREYAEIMKSSFVLTKRMASSMIDDYLNPKF